MFFYVTEAKGARQCKLSQDIADFTSKPKAKTIKKGDKCLVFSNGTLGQGARSYNYSKDKAIKMLERLIEELKSGDSDSKTVNEQTKEFVADHRGYEEFSADDIPF